MDKSINLIEYLPPILQDKMEYKEICNTESKEFIFLWSKMDDVLNDQFLSTLTIHGVKRWEKIMKITPKSSETLEDRRFRIINRYLNKLPYTMNSLKHHLNSLCGENGYKVNYDSSNYTLTIRLELSIKNQLDEVVRSLKSIIPANLVQDISLLYNQYQTVGKFTYAQLKKFTYLQIREEALN
ncbi:putative phage tail protein [Faecalimicrobium sp. JNUCC 81]